MIDDIDYIPNIQVFSLLCNAIQFFEKSIKYANSR
jgi:hypothetical protein